MAIIGQATGAIGSGNLAAIGVVDAAGNVVAPRAGLDNSLFVTVQASSSTIGGVNQAASASLPWKTMLTNGSGVQQGTSTNPLAIIGQATGSIGSANLAAIGAVNSAGNVVAPRTGLDNSLFVTIQASSSTIGNVGIVSGSAEIGQVAQGTATASAGAWPVKLTDGTDTAMLDGNGYLGVIQGTATVSAGAWPMKLTDGTDTASVDVNGYVGITQGTATASAGAWPVKITDGTDTLLIDANGYGLVSQGSATVSAGAWPMKLTDGVDTALIDANGYLIVSQGTATGSAWTVTGSSTGSVGSSNGLLMTGRDSAGNAQPFKLDTSGALQVDVESGSITVSSGTVTANQGGAPWSVSGSGTFAVTQNASGSLPWLAMLSNGSGVQQGTSTAPLNVIGTSTGSVGSANGLLSTGRDSAGNVQPIRMATDGTLRVDPTGTTTQPVSGTFWQATQPVSGTVTANIGASTSLPVLVTKTSPDGTRVTEDWRTPAVSVISVGTSATQLILSSPAKMVGACFQPLSGVIYVAESTISSAVTYPGLKLAQDTIFCSDMYAGGAWYAIATPSAVTTAVMTSVSAQ